VGRAEGAVVGSPVGAPEGATVGMRVGAWEGAAVGREVGAVKDDARRPSTVNMYRLNIATLMLIVD